DLDGAHGVVFATALYPENASVSMMPWSNRIAGGWYDLWTSTIGPRQFEVVNPIANLSETYSCTHNVRPVIDQWIDYVWVWSSVRSKMELYINGDLKSTTPTMSGGEISSPNSGINLGAYHDGSSYNW